MTNKTPLKHIYYALKLYSSGLSLRKKNICHFIYLDKKKPCISLELDTEIQAKKDIAKEKQSIRIHNR